jgi:hypothetical protein
MLMGRYGRLRDSEKREIRKSHSSQNFQNRFTSHIFPSENTCWMRLLACHTFYLSAILTIAQSAFCQSSCLALCQFPFWLSDSLTVWLSVCLTAWLSVSLTGWLSVSLLSGFLSAWLSGCLSVSCLSICPSACLCQPGACLSSFKCQPAGLTLCQPVNLPAWVYTPAILSVCFFVSLPFDCHSVSLSSCQSVCHSTCLFFVLI